jgi:hypothetical protein
MKTTKRKISLLFGLSLASYLTYSQVPTGSPPTPFPAFNPAQAVNLANNAWYRGGNTSTNNSNNIFGTAAGFNSPIFHQTAGITRMQMNGTVTNVVNVGASLSRDGFIGIGVPTGFYNGSNNY